jgi:dTDP-4-dehydrorhamnose reductase
MSDVRSVLILGATGMLGRALVAECKRRHIRAVGLARTGADINVDIRDAKALAGAVADVRPDIVINSAAVASIDDCERDPGLAYLVNARAVSIAAEAANRFGTYLVQVSTDHYFSGDGARRHSEHHPVRLVNEYARCKFAGEQFALTCKGALVVRTNVVGFRWQAHRPTFVEWVLAMLERQAPITLFSDVFVSSVDVRQFSAAIFDMLPQRPSGVLNVASHDVVSKEAFVVALAAGLGLSTEHCRAGSVRSLTGPPRADSLGLDVAQAERLLGRPLPSLQGVVESLVRESQEQARCVTTR